MKHIPSFTRTLAIVLCGLSMPLMAQDTLRTDIVDVVKTFKPILSEAIKIQSNPNPEIPETKTPVFNYSVPDKRMEGLLTLYTIKPLSLGTALLPKLKNNYTRLGYGNYNTPLLETYLQSGRNKNLQAGFFFKHLSSNPEGDRTFSNNTAYGFVKRYLGKGILSADALYYRNVVNLYGVKREGTSLSEEDIRNPFQTIEGKLAYQNVLKDTSKLSYKLDGQFARFSTTNPADAAENDFKLYGTFGKRISGNPLEIKAGVNLIGLESAGNTYNRTFIDIHPRYRININALYLNLGFNSTFFNDSNGTKFFGYPVVEAGYAILPKSLTGFIGITGNLQRNTFRSLANENPFIRTLALDNTLNKFELYGGFKGIISPQTSFLVQLGLANMQNMVFYVSDSSKLYSQAAVIDGSNAGLFTIRTELNHEFAEQFQFGFVMNYNKYSLAIDAPFSRPTFTTQWNIGYNMSDKFLWKVQAYTMNQRESRILLANNTFQDIKLKGFVDLNMGLDYRYTKNLSLFINLNNLTNNQYQRWANLPVYGLNVLGGLTVTF